MPFVGQIYLLSVKLSLQSFFFLNIYYVVLFNSEVSVIWLSNPVVVGNLEIIIDSWWNPCVVLVWPLFTVLRYYGQLGEIKSALNIVWRGSTLGILSKWKKEFNLKQLVLYNKVSVSRWIAYIDLNMFISNLWLKT